MAEMYHMLFFRKMAGSAWALIIITSGRDKDARIGPGKKGRPLKCKPGWNGKTISCLYLISSICRNEKAWKYFFYSPAAQVL